MENRYDKYKDSGIAWIGEIPEHWEVRKGKNIFKLRNSKGNSNAILLAATQKYGMIPQSQIEGVVQVKQNTNLNTFKTVHKHDYVISLRSFQGGFEISEYEGVCSPAYQVFYSTIPCCNYFFKYLFKSYGFISQINAFTLGIREGKNIQYEDFSLMKLPFPVLHEQQAIADYLDRRCSEIDELIALQEEMITKLQSYKQSVITEAVTRGLDKNVPLKDSDIDWIGKIPEHWSRNKIVRLFSIIGSGTTPKSNKEDNYIGSINWIQSGDINGGYIENCKNTISKTVLKEYSALKIYKAPFIIVAMYGASVGNISISKIDGCVNQACCVMNDTEQNFRYLFYSIISVKNYLIYKAEGGGQPNISQDKIKNTWLPIPPLAEQQAIADYLDQRCSEIDELIALKQQKIEKLKEYKKSLIFECVTGKRKVS
ncbi:restriction endonuclease subunit S [Barnesiella sp. An22]|uniref:restriction endonuclease subunit S n=1 Tax=Barnesiella sp. An22 TaxID=1965590 RepID=UPI00130235C0|nr:restriction endonuclease subunit S [Barnesiella sp. An22]